MFLVSNLVVPDRQSICSHLYDGMISLLADLAEK